MHPLKTTRLSPKIMVDWSLRSISCSKFPLSCLWLTVFFYIHSFLGIGQYCLTLITVRLGCWSQSLDKGQKTQSFFLSFFFYWQSFRFPFQDVPFNSKRTQPGRLVLPLPPLLFLGDLCNCPCCTTAYGLLLLLLKSDNGFCLHLFIFPWPNSLWV